MGAGENADAADERGVDPAAAQTDHRLVQRDKRGGAGGVDDEARTMKVEDVGQAVGDDRQRVAGHHVRIGRRHIEHSQGAVVDGRHPDEDAGIAAGELGRANAGVFQAFPGQLQQQALLRIHLLGFAGRHAERAGIETPDILEHAGGKRVGSTALGDPGMQQSVMRPAIRRDLRYGATTLGKKRPELPHRGGSGQTTSPADDSDILALVQRSIDPLASRSDSYERRRWRANGTGHRSGSDCFLPSSRTHLSTAIATARLALKSKAPRNEAVSSSERARPGQRWHDRGTRQSPARRR